MVPKCDIFDHLNSNDFYTIKPRDFGAEITKNIFTDRLDICHCINVSVCSEYADNDLLLIVSTKKGFRFL
jgi:hypothetical protein